jgi:hypothetical protein
MGQHSKPSNTGRRIAVVASAATISLLGAANSHLAFADPDFGPGNSTKGPQDAGALCHPPGQTEDFPACK